MSDSSSGDLNETASTDGPGILAGLPRTRPQRASARRTAARTKPSVASATSPRPSDASASAAPTKRAPAKAGTTKKSPARGTKKSPTGGTKRAPTKTRTAGTPRASALGNASVEERAPRQGFEAEPDSLGPVQPPGSTELVSSVAELAGELAKAGVGTGVRVLRDFLSRLPG